MIESQFRSQLLSEAIRIGDDILGRALHDEHGLFWKTMTINDASEIQWIVSENIYNGNSGVILFLIELYKSTDDSKYLNAIHSSSEWLLHRCQQNRPSSFAFCTGRIGVSYTLIQVAKLTGNFAYTEQALELARNCDFFLSGEYPCEYINGHAGTLVGLLHLHSFTGEKWLEEKIVKFADHLIQNCIITRHGVHWDHTHKNIQGLCGFSHGASGVGHALMELYNYTGSQFMYWLATQAFQYEDAVFDPKKVNWPDYRKLHDAIEEEAKMSYRNGDIEFFVPGNMSAWCHGAPGIGLARLRAKEISNKKTFDIGLENAIKNTVVNSVERPLQTFTLCHGNCGNAVLFLEAYRSLKTPAFFKYAIEVGKNSMDQFLQRGKYLPGFPASTEEDISLFMGNAGIGYYYLSLLNPAITSPLLPRVPNTKPILLEIAWDNHHEIFTKFARKLFPKTIESLRTFKIDPVDTEVGGTISLREQLTEQIRKNVEFAHGQKTARLFQLELLKLQIQDANSNAAYLFIKEKVDLEENAKLLIQPQNELLRAVLQVNTFETFSPNLEEEPILLKAHSGGVKEISVTQLSFEILNLFDGQNNINQVVAACSNLIEADDNSVVASFIIDQVKEFLKSGILIAKKSPVKSM